MEEVFGGGVAAAQASYLGLGRHERAEEERKDYGNGFYQRDFVTRLGTLRLSMARTRQKSFLPPLLERIQRRAEEVMLLVREAPTECVPFLENPVSSL